MQYIFMSSTLIFGNIFIFILILVNRNENKRKKTQRSQKAGFDEILIFSPELVQVYLYKKSF